LGDQVLFGPNHAVTEHLFEGVVVDHDLLLPFECLGLKIIGKIDGQPHQVDGVLIAHLPQLVVGVQVGHERKVLNEVDEDGRLGVHGA